jgi:hypothetical protein
MMSGKKSWRFLCAFASLREIRFSLAKNRFRAKLQRTPSRAKKSNNRMLLSGQHQVWDHRPSVFSGKLR